MNRFLLLSPLALDLAVLVAMHLSSTAGVRKRILRLLAVPGFRRILEYLLNDAGPQGNAGVQSLPRGLFSFPPLFLIVAAQNGKHFER
jgi:hypothetical protein